jgi:hypothetical protein
MKVRTRGRRLTAAALAVPVVAALALAAASAGPVQATVDDQMLDEPGAGVTQCAGGVQEASIARMNDLPTSLDERPAFERLPGSQITFNTPANDGDQIMVTFSAEARLLGQPVTYTPPADFLQIQIMLDGQPMPPLNDLAFTTDIGQSDATQACHRVQPQDAVATHRVWVEWLLVDQDTDETLTGTLDDWTLHVEIND